MCVPASHMPCAIDDLTTRRQLQGRMLQTLMPLGKAGQPCCNTSWHHYCSISFSAIGLGYSLVLSHQQHRLKTGGSGLNDEEHSGATIAAWRRLYRDVPQNCPVTGYQKSLVPAKVGQATVGDVSTELVCRLAMPVAVMTGCPMGQSAYCSTTRQTHLQKDVFEQVTYHGLITTAYSTCSSCCRWQAL